VVTAFLNPKIDRDDVYMELPEGNEVVRLKKALYGLRQAPRLWYQDINNFLLSIGFRQSIADPNQYIQDDVLLLLYVDDMLIVFNPSKAIEVAQTTKNRLLKKYKITDLGEVKRFLGLEVKRDTDGYYLSQAHYINDIVKRFQLEDAHPVHSPMNCNVNLDIEPGNECDQQRYQSIVGSLMYAAMGTRPDIMFCVSRLSRYKKAPCTAHMTAAVRCLRYLKGTSNFQLSYRRSADAGNSQFIGFTASDWAGNTSNHKSMGAYV